ncbi:MAG: heavy metal translocating P-type ATPase metal-binding domain-containing protein [Ignavibacteriales bacterium]|nr:heavy metal translocating P-type ATPase metal-binding domain-containing protein [Ignavibacteriales bacterium]
MITATGEKIKTVCFHCGTPAENSGIEEDGKPFCCAGCRAVYQILSKNRLCQYYSFEQTPGSTPPVQPAPRFEFLEDPSVSQQLVDFSDDSVTVLTLRIPQMHCSSCIWLLENLHRLDEGIVFSRVDFLRKTLLIRFAKQRTTIRKTVSLLSSLGYEPELNLGSIQKQPAQSLNRSLYLKLGVAAFCFGNIMLFSLPEYFAGSRADFSSRSLFGYLNLLLSLPVALYSSSLFYVSAWQGLRKRIINIDVPIALGIAVVFIRSMVEVLLSTGPGYFDSLTGLVFFLLIGRLFQNKTYDALNFERRYQSYFPLAAAVRKDGEERTVPITSLRPGDRIVLRNNEIIPADAVVMKGPARIDYGFVTGESNLVTKEAGELAFAGGKQVGATVELEVIKEVSESKLVQLWNDFGGSGKTKSRLLTLSSSVGKYFTFAILGIAIATGFAWWILNPAVILTAVTAILIVACPCALALAAPFAFGTTMRIFGNRGFYLKNSGIIESLSKVDTIVFDKTGTLTRTSHSSIRFEGSPLNEEEIRLVASLARSSTHPLSRTIAEHLAQRDFSEVSSFEEIEGEGIRGRVEGTRVQLGSADFVNGTGSSDDTGAAETRVHLSLRGQKRGWFSFENAYREGVRDVLSHLGNKRSLMILSGDGDRERERLRSFYDGFAEMRFNQKPADKLAFIRELQDAGRKVLMIGDGLNDAGALWQSDAAIAVTENVTSFSPACDAMLDASSFGSLNRFVDFADTSLRVVYTAFGLSVLYNIVGLWFAVQGSLSPLLAAILMPLSSISVVIFSTTTIRRLAKKKGIL